MYLNLLKEGNSKKEATFVLIFLIIKQTRCTNYSNLFLEWKYTCFGQFLCPSSGVFHCIHSYAIPRISYRFVDNLRASCQQTCMTYAIDVCTVKNSWWWTGELSETCRISFQEQIWEISASCWFCKLTANLCDIHHFCVYSEKTPDEGEKNCPKHVEFHSKNKFEKLVHLVGFASCQLTCVTYTIVVCTVKNSLWWTEELSETRRVSFKNKILRN